MTASATRILIVDDEAQQVQALTSTLDMAGYSTAGAASGPAALALLHEAAARQETAFDILLTDLNLTGMNGIELVRSAQGIDPDLVAVVMTGDGAIETAVQAMQCGAFEYILKPVNFTAIRSVLSRAVAVRRLRLQNTALAQRVKERTWELEMANRELRATNRDLVRLTRIISHDLRAPLEGIARVVESLLGGGRGPVNQAQAEGLRSISEGARQLQKLTEQLVRFANSSAAPLHKKDIDMNELIWRAIHNALQRVPSSALQVSVGPLPRATGDRDLISEAFTSFIVTAMERTISIPSPGIEVIGEQEADRAHYLICDNGCDAQFGEQTPVVLEDRVETFPGATLEVWFAYRIIERHGGRVTYAPLVDRRCCVNVQLPL